MGIIIAPAFEGGGLSARIIHAELFLTTDLARGANCCVLGSSDRQGRNLEAQRYLTLGVRNGQ